MDFLPVCKQDMLDRGWEQNKIKLSFIFKPKTECLNRHSVFNYFSSSFLIIIFAAL